MLKSAVDSVNPVSDLTLHTVLAYESLCEGQLSNRVFVLRLHSEFDSTLLSTSEDFYRFHSMGFCSDTVAARVYQRFVFKEAVEARALALKFESHPQLSTLAGKLIERLAVEEFRKPEEFVIMRRLPFTRTDSTSSHLPTILALEFVQKALSGSLPSEFLLKFDAVPMQNIEEFSSNVKLDPNLLQTAQSRNEAAIDMVLPGLIAANVSLNPKHDLVLRGKHGKGFERIAKLLYPSATKYVS
jgi:hypothetical protein